jgi:hypothetical protein
VERVGGVAVGAGRADGGAAVTARRQHRSGAFGEGVTGVTVFHPPGAVQMDWREQSPTVRTRARQSAGSVAQVSVFGWVRWVASRP